MNKQLFILILLFLCSFKVCYAQAIIKGKVKDKNQNVIPFASVLVKKDSLSSIINYAYSDEKGNYSMQIEKDGHYNLFFSSLGYDTKVVNIHINKTKQDILRDITLLEKPLSLNEVIITSDRPIRVKKDTIVFNADYFKVGNEQTVEDLLKKIPGISIDNNGTIKVQNQEIEKLMIDGDDLFEKGYKILSKNMPSYPIDKVEILNNYSNNRLLKGIEESDKVALNLELKDEFKRVWFGNINLGAGLVSENIYDTRLNFANFGKKNKYYFIGNFNNTGYDATGDIESLIRPFRDRNEPATIGDTQTNNALLNLSPNNLNFKESRTNFNNAELASLNTIFNLSNKIKIKTLGFFNWDETNFFRNSTEVVNVGGTNFTNTENFKLKNKKRVAFGKLDFIYNISKTKILEVTTKHNNGSFNANSNFIFNSNSTLELLQHQNSLFDQKISFTNKFKNRKVFLLTGRYIDEKTPQHYAINQFFYQDLFPTFNNINNVSQQSTNKMQFAGLSAHLLDRKTNGNLLELQLGNEFRKDRLPTVFTLLEDDLVIGRPDGYQNETTYQVNDLYLKGMYRFKIKNFDIISKLDVHQIFNQLENNNATTNQNVTFINPSLGFDWEINKNNKITSSYLYNTTNAKVMDVFSDFVLTGFRSFSKGTGSFSQLDASSVAVKYQFGNWSDQFFANTFIVYKKNHDFFSTNSRIAQNFTQAEKILIKDRAFITLSSNLDYYFEFISTNLKLDLGYTKSEFKNSINNLNLRQVTASNFDYGLEFRSGFKGMFNYHMGTKWTTTGIETSTNFSFTDNVSFLNLFFIFNKKMNFQLETERYYFGNLQSDNTYYFLDFNAKYKLIKNKLTLGITGKNLFNTKRFTNFSISDIGTSTTQYRLLPGFMLLKLEFGF